MALLHPLDRREKWIARHPDAHEVSKGDQFRRQLYGDRAIELLRRRPRRLPQPEILQSDTDLDAIRDRSDFQALIKDVEGNRRPTRK